MPKKDSQIPKIILRRYQDRDYPGLISLWAEAELPYKPAGRDSRANLKSQSRRGQVFFLVAESEGKLIGSVVGTHDSRKGWINRLAVARTHRGQGLGRRLIEEAERRLSRLGIEIFACLIEEGNSVSMAVFERHGYKRHPEIVYFTKRESEDT
jgi:ribosomal protein S18 acetylase RimI-like enzyme